MLQTQHEDSELMQMNTFKSEVEVQRSKHANAVSPTKVYWATSGSAKCSLEHLL